MLVQSLGESCLGHVVLICSRGGKAVRLTYDHKGSDSQEAKRITDAGGFVMNNRVNGGCLGRASLTVRCPRSDQVPWRRLDEGVCRWIALHDRDSSRRRGRVHDCGVRRGES